MFLFLEVDKIYNGQRENVHVRKIQNNKFITPEAAHCVTYTHCIDEQAGMVREEVVM
jgi:hypothetical protein